MNGKMSLWFRLATVLSLFEHTMSALSHPGMRRLH